MSPRDILDEAIDCCTLHANGATLTWASPACPAPRRRPSFSSHIMVVTGPKMQSTVRSAASSKGPRSKSDLAMQPPSVVSASEGGLYLSGILDDRALHTVQLCVHANRSRVYRCRCRTKVFPMNFVLLDLVDCREGKPEIIRPQMYFSCSTPCRECSARLLHS